MKINNTQLRKFTPQQIVQAQSIDLDLHEYRENRPSVFGITIDEVSTVDRDDGIWLVELPDDKFELQVSITDISQLVVKDSDIDQEAKERVVTHYHTSPPTPMLPNRLSTNLGSLDEDKETLAITVFFILDRRGNVLNYEIKETIFNNKKAFSYGEVEKILKKPDDIPEHKILCKLQKISQLISKNRGGKSGVLTKDGYLDEDGNLIKDNINAHQLIAELMILTNYTIASFLSQDNMSAIYRTQDMGATDFKRVIKTMGHCLVPAEYKSQSRPHVALGLISYTHFTSPLRRFVDLVNHRIIKTMIHGEKSPYQEPELDEICQHINDVTLEFKQEKSNYLKAKRKKELYRKYQDLSQINIEELSLDDLSDLIQYSANNEQIKTVIPQLRKRIFQLQPKDLYHLWFVAKIDDFWQEKNLNTVSVLLVKSQLDSCTVDYQFSYDATEQTHYCYCYIDNLTTSEPAKDSRKSKAKYKAALALIQGYIREELVVGDRKKVNLHANVTASDEASGDLEGLSEKAFSQLLNETIAKDNFDSTILNAIAQRLDHLPVKDLYKIWFLGKVDHFLDHPNLDTVSVLLIHSQLNHVQVEYEFDHAPRKKIFYCRCYVDGDTHPDVVGDIKKSKAKHKSALAYIQAYIKDQLIDRDTYLSLVNSPSQNVTDVEVYKSDRTALDPPADSNINQEEQTQVDKDNTDNHQEIKTEQNRGESSAVLIDWVSKLHELSQLNRFDRLDYKFHNVYSMFICDVQFSHDGKQLHSTGYGRNKKDAKQMASKVCFIQHNLNSSELEVGHS